MAGNHLSCDEKHIVRRMQNFWVMNVKIATNFEVVKLGQHKVNL